MRKGVLRDKDTVVQLNILGEVHLSTGDHPVRLGAGRERAMIVLLALAGGQPLSTQELADRLWDGAPPRAFRSTLHRYATRLRKRLELVGVDRSVLTHNGGGYLLRLPSQAMDWSRLTQARSRAAALRQAGDVQSARATLTEALGLWRGSPLHGLSGRWMARMRVTMERTHQEVLTEWAGLALTEGEAADVVRVLDTALAHYPMNDALHLCALRAMRTLGHTSDALVTYRGFQDRLSEELGASPSPELQREFQLLLRQTAPIADDPPRASAASDSPEVRPANRPDNLDRDLKGFRGREQELLLLTSRLREPGGDSSPTWIISGMPGIGKSTLATHAAHQVKDAYPDAHLTLDLRGNHEQLPPLTPGEAITELLRLLHLPTHRIPDSPVELVALWREHTRSLNALVILDDAASAEQVTPLLPSNHRCAIIITSRFQLPEVDEAERLPLGLPSLSESTDMFAAVGGPPARAADTDLVREIITLCGRLPLAIRLAATLMRLHPTWTLSDVLARLPRSGEQGLGSFRMGQVDLPQMFEMTLRSMSPLAREAYLLLGLHPTRILSARIAVALVGRDRDTSRRAVDELVDASLVEEHQPHRFRIHTLIKSHAYASAIENLSDGRIRAARARMHSAYLDACHSADLGLHPHRQGRDSEESATGIERWSWNEAETWMRSELPTVLTVVGDAQAHGPGGVAAELAHVLAEHLDAHGPWHSAPALHAYALRWYRQQDSPRGMARASFDLARAYLRTREPERTLWHNARAREYWRGIGDGLGEAWGMAQLGMVRFTTGQISQSRDCVEQALRVFTEHRHGPGIVFAMHVRGMCHSAASAYHEAITDFGDAVTALEPSPDTRLLLGIQLNLAGALRHLGYHREARAICEKALTSARDRGDDHQAATALTNMGELALHRHRPEEAIELLTSALAYFARIRDPWTECMTLSNMGSAHIMAERPNEARDYFRRSLALRNFSEPAAAIEAYLGLAQVEQSLGHPAEATHLLRQAIASAARHGSRREHAQALQALGRHLSHLGNDGEARRLLHAAADAYEELSAPEAALVRSLLEDERRA